MKSSLPIDLPGCMHKLAKETRTISDAKTCKDQEDKFPHKLAIGM